MLSEDEAQIKALNIIKEYNIPYNDLQFSGITYETLKKEEITYKVKQIVYFNQLLNGQPIYGVARVAIMFGGNGKLVGIYNLRKDFELVGDIPLEDTKVAFESLHKKGILNTGSKSKNGSVKGVKVGYYVSADESFIQPIFVYNGIDETNNNFFAYVPAVNESNIVLEPTIDNKDLLTNGSNAQINPPKN